MTTKEEGFVKGKAPVLEQDALVAGGHGTQANLAPKPEDSGSVSPEQVEGSVEAIRAAIAAKDGEQLTTLLSGASKAVLDAVGRNSSLVESLQDLPEAERNAAYDYLHLSITDADLLVDIIYQRFGVMLLGKNQHKKDAKGHLKQKRKSNEWAESVSNNNVDFSAAHAQQIYSAYMCVPQSALDQISLVFSETNHATNLHGYAMTPRNNICLNSQEGLENARNAVNTGMGGMGGMMGGMFDAPSSAGTASSDKDAAFNAVFTQWTAIHELGHVIDSGAYYSGSNDFRACSGWKEFGDSKKVVNDEYLKDGNVENPYLESFTDADKEVANKVAIELVETNDKNAAKKIAKNNKGKLSDYEQFLTLIEDSHESYADDGDGMNLFKAASLSNKDEVWYEMKGYVWMDKHMKRPTHYHEGTERWWSYDRDTRREGKISAYQYASAKEDFAEAYACYYYTEILDQKEKANNQMPAKLKAWFDAHKAEIES